MYYLILDLKSLQTIVLGDYVFAYSYITEISSMPTSSNYLPDLPQLKSIQLGSAALWGYNNDVCSLILRGSVGWLEEIRSASTHINYFRGKKFRISSFS